MTEEKGLTVEDQFGHDHSKCKDILFFGALNELPLLLILLSVDKDLRRDIGKCVAWRIIFINEKVLGFLEHTS